MFHLLPGRKILTTFASINVGLILILLYFLNPSNKSLEMMRYLGMSVTILDLIAFFVTIYLWRFIWEKIPVLSDIYFPDINGIWEGRIFFLNSLGEEQALIAKVRIKQNLWQINMDLCSETSKSSTLVAYPTLEAGSHKLYYVYQNVPKNPQYPEYKGTSILELNVSSDPVQLRGQYYTIRGTQGRIELVRSSLNPKEGYELY
jgi:SMODS-associating 2TM, beta-strand rich effector domain